jgi:hypothetical protein
MTNTTAAAPSFTTGGDAAQAEAEANRPSGGGARPYGYLKAGGKGSVQYLRYLTDDPDWIQVKVHSSVPTKDAPADAKNWPSSMSAVCRMQSAFAGMYHSCWNCDHPKKNTFGGDAAKTTLRVYALAVLREEVYGTQEMVDAGQILSNGKPMTADQIGRRVGLVDKKRKVKDVDGQGKATENEIEIPDLVLICRSMNNHFGSLHSIYGIYGSIVDRDMAIKQEGEGKDVQYNHIALEPSALRPGSDGWKRYTDVLDRFGVSLPAIVADQASDDYYNRFFVTDGSAPVSTTKAESAQSDDAGEDSAARLAAMRDRIQGQPTVPGATIGD